MKAEDRIAWRAWIWEQQVRRPLIRTRTELEANVGEKERELGGDEEEDEDEDVDDGSIVL